MVADTLASASITSLDTLPTSRPDTGEGAPGMSKQISDFVSVTTGGLASTSSTYKMVRLPSTAKLKALRGTSSTALDTNGSPTLAINVGAYYSDAPSNTTLGPVQDGTQPALAGTSISANCFASATVFGVKQNGTDLLSNFAPSKRNKPLWSALGLSSNPGGFIDIVVAVQAAAATAAAGELGIEASYVM